MHASDAKGPGQGLHIDPLDPAVERPDPATYTALQRAAYQSPSMGRFRECLLLPGAKDTRSSVLDDLATFYGLSPDECVERCLHWERLSVEEWKRHDRSDPSAIREFYQSTESWSFDLLWYAYLQAEGYLYPVSVAIVECLRTTAQRGGEHLDFGAGVGVTGQLFSRLGYRSSLADVSTTLQAFAKFRLERRDDAVTFIDLNKVSLEPNRYDVITAIDTLVHIPDLQGAMNMLHRALKPGGFLFANFDTRAAAEENAWHLYSDDLELRWLLHRTGFEPAEKIDLFSTMYRRVENQGAWHAARGVRDLMLMKNPLRPLYRTARGRVRTLVKRLAGG
jgi:SAM-dependent methyltransferase